MRQLLAMTVFSLFFLGCAPAADPPAQEVDWDAERTSVIEADRAMLEAYSTSDTPVDALMAQFSDDANVLAPDMPMAKGLEESRAVFAAMEAMPGYSLTWSPSAGDVDGDLGYTIGAYHIELQDADGNPLAIDGKYMTVWNRQSDGTWKVAVDMFNANGPPTPVEK